jgi:hypothetical protein
VDLGACSICALNFSNRSTDKIASGTKQFVGVRWQDGHKTRQWWVVEEAKIEDHVLLLRISLPCVRENQITDKILICNLLC